MIHLLTAFFIFGTSNATLAAPLTGDGDRVRVQIDFTIERSPSLDLGFTDNRYDSGPGLPPSFNPGLVNATLTFEPSQVTSPMQRVKIKFDQPLAFNLRSSAGRLPQLFIEELNLPVPGYQVPMLKAYGRWHKDVVASFGDFDKEAETFLNALENGVERLATSVHHMPALYRYAHLALNMTIKDLTMDNAKVDAMISAKFQRVLSPNGEVAQGYFHRSTDLRVSNAYPIDDPKVRKVLESIQELRKLQTVDGKITRDGRLIVRKNGQRVTVEDAKRRTTILSILVDKTAEVTMAADSSRYVILGFKNGQVGAYFIGSNEFVGEVLTRGEGLQGVSFQGATMAVDTKTNRAVYHAATLEHLFDQPKSELSKVEDSCSYLLTQVRR